MQLVIIELNSEDHVNDLLSILVETGNMNAQIMTSEAAGQLLAREVPIFAGFQKLLGPGRAIGRVVMVRTENGEKLAEDIRRLFNEMDLSLSDAGVDAILVMPVILLIEPEQSE